MADQRTPEEQAGMSDAERERFPTLTKRQLDRRIVLWSLALVVLVVVIVVMVIRG
jgi:hypothetical protein